MACFSHHDTVIDSYGIFDDSKQLIRDVDNQFIRSMKVLELHGNIGNYEAALFYLKILTNNDRETYMEYINKYEKSIKENNQFDLRF